MIDGLAHKEHDRSIVETSLAVTEALELDGVAEGVEGAEPADWLRQRGVCCAQGFVYCRHMPLIDCIDWQRKHSHDGNRARLPPAKR